MQRNILYVGGFVLPDKNAAAQRVMGNAKALRVLGHQICFLNYSDEAEMGWTEYDGFRCYNKPKQSMLNQLISIRDVKQMIRELSIMDVIAYNYPAVALSRLLRFCKHNQIRCIADATEWYVAEGMVIYRIIKNTDTWCRMRRLHFQMDGVVAISEYLYQYYNRYVQTIKIPPLVDTSVLPEHSSTNTSKTVFLYAGSPSAQKERLDLVVNGIISLPNEEDVELRVVGITADQYLHLYGQCIESSRIHFLGRLDHFAVLNEYQRADWSIVIRDNNLVVKAGFPTKVSESISCGVPVIVNRFSNVTDYINDGNGYICDEDRIEDALLFAMSHRLEPSTRTFSFECYSDEFAKMF